ncbi:uncharacterized protein LOC128768186 isoform X1 [Synchiropus splendidus]|uniref:uncharacterized protein LOC128768186 isoform X1 n=1 Tax=Synchiropus splendidus TaxID=270530 RepID=UPI00237E8845|nr:uncharacterized protein LOC128768186 isoform X1 [Synchiropus splendidus]
MSPQSTTWFFVYTSLLFSFLGINSASDGSIRYSTVGSSVVLSPNSDVKHFSSLTWKIGPDLAMEWYGTEVFAYRQFKERGMLNTTSGEMTISGLTPADSGLYTAITNDIHTNRTRLEVIYNVPKPTLSVSCDTRDKCLLACGGNTSGAGPVSFSWDVDGLVLDGLPTEIVLTELSNKNQAQERSEAVLGCRQRVRATLTDSDSQQKSRMATFISSHDQEEHRAILHLCPQQPCELCQK